MCNVIKRFPEHISLYVMNALILYPMLSFSENYFAPWCRGSSKCANVKHLQKFYILNSLSTAYYFF
jgi:hypothetical protein